MRAALAALTEELRRLRAGGVQTVVVSDESLAALKRAAAFPAGRRPGPRQTEPGGVPAVPAMPSDKGERASRPRSGPETGGTPALLSRSPPAPSLRSNDSSPSQPAAASTLPPPPKVVLKPGSKSDRWKALLETVVNDPVCRAHVRPGRKVVLGVGSLEARIMFVGEAPGAEEEVQGEPFVGPAGQLLTRMIAAMGLKREEVYIGNIMNWRPELPLSSGIQIGNRPPTGDEMAYCLPYLKAQLDIVDPALVVALGTTAAQGLLGFGTFRSLSEIRGRWREFQGRPLMVTYHPSYILRNQSNRAKRMIWEDLLQVMERAGLAVSEKQKGYFLDR